MGNGLKVKYSEVLEKLCLNNIIRDQLMMIFVTSGPSRMQRSIRQEAFGKLRELERFN